MGFDKAQLEQKKELLIKKKNQTGLPLSQVLYLQAQIDLLVDLINELGR